MVIRTKKIIACELLILIIPIVLLLIITAVGGLYFKLSIEGIDNKEAALSKEFHEIYKSKIDSLKIADSLALAEIIQKMKEANEPTKNIDLVTDHVKNRKYSTDEPLISIQGDTVYVNPDLSTEKLKLDSSRTRLNNALESLFGNNHYDGLLGIIYLIFLILIYPIRLLIYAMVWSVKTLKDKQ